MTSILDRPIWSALESRHAHLAEGGPLARRYPPAVSQFAATGDDTPESLEALAGLARAGETMLIVQTGDIRVPPGLAMLSSAAVVQMTLIAPLQTVTDARIEPLGWADAAAMYDLAMRTRPGPFTLKALEFGDFWGIRIDGKLVAMAGERLKQPGHTELSGVCVDEAYRGQGFARLLSRFVAGRIQAAGQTAYLHSYAANAGAIGLYQSIGFAIRTELTAAALARTD